jgi:NMD protein affecting ribosome stability and mRNA decay
MSDRDQTLDFQATLGANIDSDTGESLAHSWRMPADATEEELTARAVLVHRVCWRMIAMRNQRTWMRDYRIRQERLAILARMRKNKEKVREQDFHAEEVNINTRLAKYEAEIRVDAEMAGEDGDAVMARLRAEALADVPVTAPEQ